MLCALLAGIKPGEFGRLFSLVPVRGRKQDYDRSFFRSRIRHCVFISSTITLAGLQGWVNITWFKGRLENWDFLSRGANTAEVFASHRAASDLLQEYAARQGGHINRTLATETWEDLNKTAGLRDGRPDERFTVVSRIDVSVARSLLRIDCWRDDFRVELAFRTTGRAVPD